MDTARTSESTQMKKVAIVTGAARGIGRASAVALARLGVAIVGLDICAPVYPPSGVKSSTTADLDETQRQVEAVGVRWLGLVLDHRYAQALDEAGEKPNGSSSVDESRAKRVLVAKTPLGAPWIAPEDVAQVVAFLASDAARMVSGATYDVTGGDSAHNAA